MDLQLTQYMRTRVESVSTNFHRYLYTKINWKRKMFGLVGPRGVGKTTMFLQYIRENEQEKKMFYATADHVYFSSHTLIELADEFVKEGGQQLFIDEIHKYRNWSVELKNIYDAHPDLMVAFTGSSILDLEKGEADLSRRAPLYHLQGLSFREYLELFKGIKVSTYSIDEIVNQKAALPIAHPLPLFTEYLHRGYYPFGNDPEFLMLMNQIVNQTLEVDIPQFGEMSVATARKLKKLMSLISQSAPFKPVMDKLSNALTVSRNTLPDYFVYMEKAGLITQLRDASGGMRGLGKIEKVYIDNPNLAYSLGGVSTEIGNIRETFFFNQMRVENDVTSSRLSDFEINGMTFEVGGKNKTQKQIRYAKMGFIVKDDIEFGANNIIPLWAFGLNY